MLLKYNLTIVIPMFNNIRHVEETIQSLLLQSYREWNCIIIDDFSNDGSPALVKNLIKNDIRFRLIIRENDSIRNANVCRNIGLNSINTNYVMFLDADDYLHKNCIRNRIVDIMKGNADLYVFRTAFVNDYGEVIGYFKTYAPKIDDLIYLFFSHSIPWQTMSLVWNTNFLKKLGGWNEEYERLQDVELSIRALFTRPVIRFSNNSVDSYYRKCAIFSEEKKKSARMGFCKIVKDFHEKVSTDRFFETLTKINIQRVFQNILETQFLVYIKETVERNHDWERLYLDTLRDLDIEESDQERIRIIFSKL